MAGEPETIVPSDVPELEAPAIEEPEQEQPTDPADEAEAGEGEQPELDENGQPKVPAVDESEFEEIEVNGVKHKVSKDLKPLLMMQKDYTQKTQEVAEQKRAVEQRANLTDNELRARADIAGAAAFVKQYENVDWDAYEQQDPIAAQRLYRQVQAQKETIGKAQGFLQQAEQHRTQEAQRDFAKRVEETQSFAKTKIPGWSAELGNKIEAYCKTSGLTDRDIKDAMSPGFLKFAYDAYLGQQVQQRQAAPKPKPAPTLQPLQTVAGKSSAPVSRSLTDLAKGNDMDAFAKAFLPKVNARRR